MANTATVAMPLQLHQGRFNSPLDARLKLVIDGEEPTQADFESIKEPFIHMQIHVHKTSTNLEDTITEECIGVYEVDSIKEVTVLGIKTNKIDTYHKVYSTSSGLYENYEPDGKHKDIIYYCTDTEGDYIGKVYFNSLPYGGGSGSDFTIDATNKLLIVQENNKSYGCSLVELSDPANVNVTATGDNTSASRVLSFTSDKTSEDTFMYRIKTSENGEWGEWSAAPSKSYTLNASTESKTTTIWIQIQAIRYGRITASEIKSFTASRHMPAITISVNGDDYELERTITITPASTVSGGIIYYTKDGSNPAISNTRQVYNNSSKPVLDNSNSSYTIKAIYVATDWESTPAQDKSVTVGKLKMWYAVVNSVPTTDSGVTSLANSKKQDALPLTFTGLTGTQGQYLVVAVKQGITVSKMTGGGFDYSFVGSTSTSYNIYAAQLGGTMSSSMTWNIS